MNRYYVVTPQYEMVDVILDDGTGPTEMVADVIEIEADSARDAVAFGVREMLRESQRRWRSFQWCQDQRSSGLSPYSGVRAIPVTV